MEEIFFYGYIDTRVECRGTIPTAIDGEAGFTLKGLKTEYDEMPEHFFRVHRVFTLKKVDEKLSFIELSKEEVLEKFKSLKEDS